MLYKINLKQFFIKASLYEIVLCPRVTMGVGVSCETGTRQRGRTPTACTTSPGSCWPSRRLKTTGRYSTPTSYWMDCTGETHKVQELQLFLFQANSAPFPLEIKLKLFSKFILEGQNLGDTSLRSFLVCQMTVYTIPIYRQ